MYNRYNRTWSITILSVRVTNVRLTKYTAANFPALCTRMDVGKGTYANHVLQHPLSATLTQKLFFLICLFACYVTQCIYILSKSENWRKGQCGFKKKTTTQL
jgi:hypothetical protein